MEIPKHQRRYKWNNTWETMALTDAEEKELDDRKREQFRRIMIECMEDARAIVKDGGFLKKSDWNLTEIAIAFFQLRVRHIHFDIEQLLMNKVSYKYSSDGYAKKK